MRRLIALVFAALLAAAPLAQAAVAPNSFITPQTPQGYTPVQIVNGTASAYLTILTGATNGSKITAIFVSNDDTSAYTLTCAVKVSSTDYQWFQVSIPAASGNSTSYPPIELLGVLAAYGSPLKDSDGVPYFTLASGAIFECKSGTTVTSAKHLTFVPFGADF